MVKTEKKQKTGIKDKIQIASGCIILSIIVLIPISFLGISIYNILNTEGAILFIVLCIIIFSIFIFLSIYLKVKKHKKGKKIINLLIKKIRANNILLGGKIAPQKNRYAWQGLWNNECLEIELMLTDKKCWDALEVHIPFEKEMPTPFWLYADNDYLKCPQEKPDFIKQMNVFSLSRIKGFPQIDDLKLFTQSPHHVFLCLKKRNSGYKYLFPKLNDDNDIVFTEQEDPMESLFIKIFFEKEEPVKFINDNINTFIKYISLLIKLRNYMLTQEKL